MDELPNTKYEQNPFNFSGTGEAHIHTYIHINTDRKHFESHSLRFRGVENV
jgi:hypothetical protein